MFLINVAASAEEEEVVVVQPAACEDYAAACNVVVAAKNAVEDVADGVGDAFQGRQSGAACSPNLRSSDQKH